MEFSLYRWSRTLPIERKSSYLFISSRYSVAFGYSVQVIEGVTDTSVAPLVGDSISNGPDWNAYTAEIPSEQLVFRVRIRQ